MGYPSPAEFDVLLLERPLEEVVNEYIFSGQPYGGIPFAFRRRPGTMRVLADHVRQSLNIPAAEITVIGSGKVGFSLSPDNYSRPFRKLSDLDVMIVDERLFDEAWHCLIRWNYPRRDEMPYTDYRWARQRHEEVFWGWIVPTKIKFEAVVHLPEILKPLRDLKDRWFGAFQSLSRRFDYPELTARRTTGRLYRTRKHALMYHVDVLARIRDNLRSRQKGE